jgi:hypothetical protein
MLQRDTEQSDPDLNSLLGSKDDGLSADGLKEFEDMVDDMVYRVWECGRCLSMGNKALDCVNEIHRWACFSYGHVAKKNV